MTCQRAIAASGEDGTLAGMYLSMWFLATGRRLRRGVRPEDLTEDELIEFWADDLSQVSGRHAASAAVDAR